MSEENTPETTDIQDDKQEIAVKENAAVAPAENQKPRFSEQQMQAASLDNLKSLPELVDKTKHFVPLDIEYWSPTEDGEEKRVYIIDVAMHDVPDFSTKELKPLECVLFLEKREDTIVRIICGSKILVGNIKSAINRGEIVPKTSLTPLSIVYKGKKQTKSGNMASHWQISTLESQDT